MTRSPPSAAALTSTRPRTLSSKAAPPPPPLGGVGRRAASHVARRPVGRFGRETVGGQLLWRAVAGIGPVLAQQPLGRLGVEREPLHLARGPDGAARGVG